MVELSGKVAWLPSTSGIVTEIKKTHTHFMIVNNVSSLLVLCDFNSSPTHLLPEVDNLASKNESKSLFFFFRVF